MTEEPFIDGPAAKGATEDVPAVRLWAAVAFLSVGVAVLVAASVFVWPMIWEGFFVHPPAKATVLGRDILSTGSGDRQRADTVFLVGWTDDRGRAQEGKLRTAWTTFAPGSEVEVRYALKADGTAAEVWTGEPDLVWLAPLVLFFSATVTTVLLFAQTLGRAVRASRRP